MAAMVAIQNPRPNKLSQTERFLFGEFILERPPYSARPKKRTSTRRRVRNHGVEYCRSELEDAMAIQITEKDNGKILEVLGTGKLTHEDYQKFTPEFER